MRVFLVICISVVMGIFHSCGNSNPQHGPAQSAEAVAEQADFSQVAPPARRDRQSIQRTLLPHIAELRHEYQNLLKENPVLRGKVTIKMVIDHKGVVTDVVVLDSELNHEDFESFIVTRIRTWRFEEINKPGDLMEVVYPFVFNP